MNSLTLVRMTVEQFQDWLDARAASLAYDEPKWELFDGVPEMQSSERWLHGRLKVQIMLAFRSAIDESELPFEVALDSIGVRIGPNDEYVPEAVVFPAGIIGDNDRQAPKPIIVVEVLSPSTRNKDLRTKADGYGRVPTIQHYLAVDPDGGVVVHFQRKGAKLVRPRDGLEYGELRLAPPGLVLKVKDLLPER